MESLDLWIKTLHIVFVIAWMAGMLYLPRLFVYHADAKVGSELSETLKVMERRLLKGIVNPAMIAVWLTGPLLAYRLEYWLSPWLHVKVALAVMLLGDGAKQLNRLACGATVGEGGRGFPVSISMSMTTA
jgi:putative membrane protein